MKKSWVVAVDMGYGHQRAAYPLRHLAFGGEVINTNNYQGMPKKDKELWQKMTAGFEFISRFKKVPLIGKAFFSFFDHIQRILAFYPRRDLSRPNIQLKQILCPVKKGLGRHLIKKLSENPLPFIGTFFTAVYMAEEFNYPGDIYSVICDTDISRTWAPLNPQKSKIKYLAPTSRSAERLQLYGVKKKNIFLTGFPLPLENIGGEDMGILKDDLRYRFLNLDAKGKYFKKYKILIEGKLGKLPKKSNHVLTIMFAVGGAGAQKEIGVSIVNNLAKKIKAREVKVVLVAGIREEVKEYFDKKTKDLPVEIIFDKDINNYFQKFNKTLRKTDILWTKPSELSFYSALGLPIIIAPTIGSQEKFNKRWLLNSGFGFLQKNPVFINQWLFDWLEKGYLAEAAMQGFIEGNQSGTFNIEKICCG